MARVRSIGACGSISRRSRPNSASAVNDLSDEGARAPLIETPVVLAEIDDRSPPAFVRFFGEAHRRAPWQALVRQEIERSGCHWACTYPQGKRPRRVQDGLSIFIARLVHSPDDMLIYGRAIGMRHQPGRDDATEAEILRRPWKRNWPHYIRVHHAEFIAGRLENGLSLRTLIDDLGPIVFASTARNLAAGDGNLVPRQSLRQQAAVQLTAVGYQEMNRRFEEALGRWGTLPAAELEPLDWPE